MKMTTRGRYAIRAMVRLALDGTAGNPVSIRMISEKEDISPEFLEQIFYKLRRCGIVDSIRGPGGGFRLARGTEEISVKDILVAVEENLELAPCLAAPEGCDRRVDCPASGMWYDLSGIMDGFLSNKSIASIIGSGDAVRVPPSA